MSADEIAPVAGVVVRNNQGQYLLVQEGLLHVYGLWNLPAGKLGTGESLQEAAVREAGEETGFEVELTDDQPLLTTVDKKANNRQLNSFRARIVGGALTVQEEELLDVRWFSLDEIKALNQADKLRSPWVINSIVKAENAHSRH